MKKKMRIISVIGLLLIVYMIFLKLNNKDESKKNDTDIVHTISELELVESENKSTDSDTSTELYGEHDANSDKDNKEKDIKQPQAFIDFLNKANFNVEYINELRCEQLIIVESDYNQAKIFFYECIDGLWIDTNLDSNGYVGEYGVSSESYEGSRMTPAGLFSVGDAFYIEEMPETGLNSFQILENSYWIDDPQSIYYNQYVELDGEPLWNSAEHMIDYRPHYEYGFVINFNMNPVIPEKGSAIFFHVGNNMTAGCVAVSEKDILNYLKRLDKNKNPHILILE